MWGLATKTFAANFPDASVFTSKLEHLRPEALIERFGRFDLLLSSPECTSHTCAKGSAPRSEASRQTAFQVLRYARILKPRWLVLENVVHMRPWPRYEELKSELQKTGYRLREQILDASDFGVPQSRRRLFLMGDLESEPPLISPAATCKRTVLDILDPVGTWPSSPLYRKGRAKPTLARAQRAMRALGNDASFLVVYYGSDGSGGWQPLNRPLRTITTVDRFALVERTSAGPRMRMLQVPELQRAMGFGDAYKLPFGTRRDKIKLLGNAVCPPVMTAIVASLTGASQLANALHKAA